MQDSAVFALLAEHLVSAVECLVVACVKFGLSCLIVVALNNLSCKDFLYLAAYQMLNDYQFENGVLLGDTLQAVIDALAAADRAQRLAEAV